MEEFQLKRIHENAIPEALARAERYRLLGDPVQAESICRDVLRVEPGSQPALVILILALTDQFSGAQSSPGPRVAREYVAQLGDEYQKLYYSGLISERQARAMRGRGLAAAFAYEGLREAMDFYEKAERVSPPGNDDAILRWNSCVRTIRRENLRPRAETDQTLSLE